MFAFENLFAPKAPKPILVVTTNKEPKDLYKWVKQQPQWRGITKEYHIIFIENPRIKVPKPEILEPTSSREIDVSAILLPFMGIVEDIIKTMPEVTESKKSKKAKAKAK